MGVSTCNNVLSKALSAVPKFFLGSPGRVGAAQLSGAFPSAGDLKNLLVPPPSLESRGSETLRPGIANPFRLSCCFLMYATSLGGLSGLGTFYKRDLLMTKLM